MEAGFVCQAQEYVIGEGGGHQGTCPHYKSVEGPGAQCLRQFMYKYNI